MPDLLELYAEPMLRDPYPAYQAIRQLDPVHWSPSWQAWFLTRHADIAAALRDPRLSVAQVSNFSRRLPQASPRSRAQLQQIENWLRGFLLFQDPPAHSRLRLLVSKAFRPQHLEGIAPQVQARVEALMQPWRSGQVVELIGSLASLLPVMTIADFLAGPSQDLLRLQDWSQSLTRFLGDESLSSRQVALTQRSLVAMADYFGDLLQQRRQEPRDDLLSRLATAQEGRQTLTQSEIVTMAILLFAAGHDTTTQLIANGLLTLLQHPEQAALLRQQPGLWERGLDELFRYESPSLIVSRVAREDLELGGQPIAQGQSLNLCLGAANRDPEVYPEPDRFWVEREPVSLLVFGKGIHFCLGAFLARLEAQAVFRTLLQRWPQSRIVGPALRSPSLAFRRLQQLPVELRP